MRTSIKALRPEIPTASVEQANPLEQFQNETLRPILKYQHDLLMVIMNHYFDRRKGEFFKILEKKKKQYLEDAIKKDLRFKAMLQGVIIGLFSESEYVYYAEHEAELGRRMTDLLVQRYQSQIAELTAMGTALESTEVV